MSKRINQLLVKEFCEYFKGMESCVLISYRGVTAEASTKMRATLREKDIHVRVIKNRLSRIALKEMGLGAMAGLMEGPTVIAWGKVDPIALTKAVADCAKDKTKMDIKGGYCEGKILSASQVQEFARIPSREVLLAWILGGIQSPLAGVAGVFVSIQRCLVTALKAIADQKAKAQPA